MRLEWQSIRRGSESWIDRRSSSRQTIERIRVLFSRPGLVSRREDALKGRLTDILLTVLGELHLLRSFCALAMTVPLQSRLVNNVRKSSAMRLKCSLLSSAPTNENRVVD